MKTKIPGTRPHHAHIALPRERLTGDPRAQRKSPGGPHSGKPSPRPSGLELIFLYSCPLLFPIPSASKNYLGRRMVPLANPTQPSMAQCDACREHFPIVPVDERSISFVKIMLAGGKAGIDPDFI